MEILRDISRAIKGLFHREREGGRCPRCGAGKQVVECERVYTRFIVYEDGSEQPARFDSLDRIYKTRDQILCARCGYRWRAIAASDDGKSER